MGCFWSYFLFSRPAQTLAAVAVIVLMVHGVAGIAVLICCLLIAGYVTEWRVRRRQIAPETYGPPQPFTPSEHVSRATAYIPWKREVRAFSMGSPDMRALPMEMIGLSIGIGLLILVVVGLAWLGGEL